MTDPNAHPELVDLAFLALDHGLESISAGGPLVPFAIVEGADGRRLARFVCETLEEGQERARQHVRAVDDVERAVIAYDGYVTVEGERFDAILVEAQEGGQPESVVFGQRYRHGNGSGLEVVGNPGFLGPDAPLL